jgi:predicted GNAT superfamily acetyltransferase
MQNPIVVRPLREPEEFRACHAVQRETWDFPDLLIVPYTQLLTIQHNGGIVLGAFDGQNLIGFVYGFLGRDEGKLYLFSQRMGVLPAYQGRGIGERLKWAQREWALQQALERIVWTFDPLEAPNAFLNVTKLGGVVHHYLRDIYGQHDTPLHSGLPTDRFLLEWELNSERVVARQSSPSALPDACAWLSDWRTPINGRTLNTQGLPVCGPLDLEARGRALLAAVPAHWQMLRKADGALAGEWRLRTRELFEHYLHQGYTITGYARASTEEEPCNLYLLEHIVPGYQGEDRRENR